MFNVLLVEDDIHELEKICSSGIWSGGEFALIANAKSGEEAWGILQKEKIDIVVTDIIMPVMDGLELSSRIRDSLPNVKIIILSGFGDFQYTHQAMSLGVNEYLMKPFKPKDLLETLKKLAVNLTEEMQINEDIMNYRLQIQNDKKHQQNVFLENLSFGIIPVENLKQQVEILELNLDFQTVCCAVLSFYENKIFIDELDHYVIIKIQQMIEKTLKTQDIIFFNIHPREYLIIFKNPEYAIIKDLLKKIKNDISKLKNPSQGQYCPKIALGGVKEKISGISESFADARFLLNFHHMVDNEDLLFMDEVLPFLQLVYQSDLGIANEIELITKTLNFGTQADIIAIVENLVGWLKSGNCNLIFFQNICIKITNIISQFLIIIDEDPDELLLGKNDGGGSLLSDSWQEWFNDIPAFKKYLISTLSSIINIRDKKKRYKYDVILKAKKYIDQHFNDPNIRLTSIASFININPSYFSTLFNQEIGESFIEYLTGIRINKAKLLLQTTNMRILDIAFAVGFSDSNYFSTIFKRITGESPKSFKSRTDRSIKATG